MDHQSSNYLENLNKLFSSQQNNQQNILFEPNDITQLNIKNENYTKDTKKTKNIFRIKKFHKYDEILEEICSEENHSDGEKIEKKDSKRRRVSAFSKVNFTKLKNEEKDERLQNLSKLVKRLRRKVKNLENKFKNNTNKLLTKFISHSLGFSKRKKPTSNNSNLTMTDLNKSTAINNSNLNGVNNSLEIDVDKICMALNNLRNYDNFEYEDEKHIIENLINLIAENKLPLDSINFRKICTQLRLLTPNEKINYLNKKGQKITFSFPERDINITAKEYDYYSNFKDREDVIRMILGIKEPGADSSYPEKINFDLNNKVKDTIPIKKHQEKINNFNKNVEINTIDDLNQNNLLPLSILPNLTNNDNFNSKNMFLNNNPNLIINNNNPSQVQNLFMNSMFGNFYHNLFDDQNKNI